MSKILKDVKLMFSYWSGVFKVKHVYNKTARREFQVIRFRNNLTVSSVVIFKNILTYLFIEFFANKNKNLMNKSYTTDVEVAEIIFCYSTIYRSYLPSLKKLMFDALNKFDINDKQSSTTMPRSTKKRWFIQCSILKYS